MTYEEIREKLLEKVRKKIHTDKDRLHWQQSEILNFQQAQLQKLIRHVLHHSPYYRERCKKMKALKDIKPSTKEDIMQHWDDIICIPGLTKAVAENHLLQYRNNEITNPFYKNYYYITATGGSSGLRGIFVWDLDFFSVAGYAAFRYQYHDELTKPIRGPKKIATLTAPTLIHASTPLFTMTLDDETTAVHFPVDLNMDVMCDQLNEFQPTHLIGYSSIITELALHALAGKLKISPQRVSTNSEPLEAETRATVKKAWDIEINNMWGSVEMGMAGIESDKHCGLFVSDDLLIIEAVNDQLKPIKKPTDVKKLLITNLFNFTFPLIRYVVDDVAIIEKTDLSGYRIAKDIEGRSDSWFTYAKNIKIHPMIFRNILGQEPAISEYQVEQTTKGVIVRLILNAKINLDELNKKIVIALQEAGLISPQLQIETLAELPRHQETGKLKRFIPLK